MLKVAVKSKDQIQETIKAIQEKGVTVFAIGSGSRGLVPSVDIRRLLMLDLSRLNRITDIQQSDFFVKCQAGVPLSELFTLLDERGLRFPFLRRESKGTVGGMVASGEIKAEEGVFSTSRWVLSVNVILGDGSESASGAVTFKSVAGYDLPKLFAGSYGTLGIITDIALRCFPDSGGPFGKDLKPAAERKPLLTDRHGGSSLISTQERISRKLKQHLDPQGIFPVIEGWNNDVNTA